MGTAWEKLHQEMDQIQDCDPVRRRLLAELAEYTGRDTIIYVADFLDPSKGKPTTGVSLDWSDKLAFQEIIAPLAGPTLDIIIESPGGMPEAAESIVGLLRNKFTDIRFIVPNIAKSAGTMLALSGNAILMDEKSELGPTDPQMVMRKEGNTFVAPAQAILDQFKRASEEITQRPESLPVWIPILNHYGPSLLQECENANRLTQKLTSSWLQQFMFANDPDAVKKAESISMYFSNNAEHLSHGRTIGINEAMRLGLNIIDMRNDPVLQEKVWELYVSIGLTWELSPAVKMLENHLGAAFIKQAMAISIPVQQGIPPAQAPTQLPNQNKPNRAERRRQDRQK